MVRSPPDHVRFLPELNEDLLSGERRLHLFINGVPLHGLCVETDHRQKNIYCAQVRARDERLGGESIRQPILDARVHLCSEAVD